MTIRPIVILGTGGNCIDILDTINDINAIQLKYECVGFVGIEKFETIIRDYSCIAGGVCISGVVVIGKSCYIGTNSSIKQNVSIGDFSLVGMNSAVLRDVPKNNVVVGNPAKFLRYTR
ncbi:MULTISPECIES: hypothetical protein [unclassified Paenibacillus]|uniref:hypothetical protein n=1 Tax=unclassified Paenibacillus TaxID=185978 RepID=UPI0024072B50|nr:MULTISPECIES: hypothetical protein [unclassified Paenibacillus]MDF9843632.1 acetyltransferase-like isoleucine patch superfamily enzyme [Paenibacillus sp. PastF-2]MDF9850220.1 acetyltransferase-like isoleucine patch superfamily enzyme [Paenibacillus sp. PastM-2]MDF9856840.1 acetyltransferase-like isoleucine patch superfamily enzyme [Paenibacillus sp. PastF-1]MDH6482067.1 acetyltransferase-like isoleucine patch superfamily enzyme [Paenibacillus sp. PastH-2]MDH6509490.1 acetyltransferase-like 